MYEGDLADPEYLEAAGITKGFPVQLREAGITEVDVGPDAIKATRGTPEGITAAVAFLFHAMKSVSNMKLRSGACKILYADVELYVCRSKTTILVGTRYDFGVIKFDSVCDLLDNK